MNTPTPAAAIPKAEPDRRELFAAITRVMTEVGYVQKQRGQNLGYTFAGEAAIVMKLHDSFARHGLCILPVGMDVIESGTYQTATNKTSRRTILKVTYDLCHVSGQTKQIVAFGEGADIGDKSFSKAMTIAYKYALRQATMLATGDDPDEDPSEDFEQKAKDGGNNRPQNGQGNKAQGGNNRQQGNNQGGNRPQNNAGNRPGNQGGPGNRQQGGNPNPQQNANGEKTNAQIAFERRCDRVPKAKDMAELNKFREVWVKDGAMTQEMKDELEKLYWVRRRFFEGQKQDAGQEPEPEGGYGDDNPELFPGHEHGAPPDTTATHH